MARVNRVAKSRKVYRCGQGHDIPIGEPYLYANPGFRSRTRLIRCTTHPFRPSELTTSLASEPMAAQESFLDAIDEIDVTSETAIEELEAEVEALLSEVEQYRDARQEALDAWEHGNSTLEEFVETADAAVDEISSFTADNGTDYDEVTPEEWEEYASSIIEEARDMASGLEF